MTIHSLKSDGSLSKKLAKRVAGTSLAGLLLLAASSSHAQIVWTGEGEDNDFFTAENWDLGTYTGQIRVNLAVHSNLLVEDAALTANASIVAGGGYTFTFRNSFINSEENHGGFFRGQGTGTDNAYAQSVYSFFNTTAYLERIGVTTALHLDSTSAVYFSATSTIPINANSTIYLAPGATITFVEGITTEARFQTLASRIVNSATGETLEQNAGFFVQTGDWSNGAFTVRAIPEPSSVVLLLAGAGGLSLLARRKRNQS